MVVFIILLGCINLQTTLKVCLVLQGRLLQNWLNWTSQVFTQPDYWIKLNKTSFLNFSICPVVDCNVMRPKSKVKIFLRLNLWQPTPFYQDFLHQKFKNRIPLFISRVKIEYMHNDRWKKLLKTPTTNDRLFDRNISFCEYTLCVESFLMGRVIDLF